MTLPHRTPRPERIYWLRRTVAASASAGPLQVTAGLVSESYEIYANGVPIGGAGDFEQARRKFFRPRSFTLPPEVFRPGAPLVIGLRIWNPGLSWGAMTSGVRDRGPYWITDSEHASAEVDAAQSKW